MRTAIVCTGGKVEPSCYLNADASRGAAPEAAAGTHSPSHCWWFRSCPSTDGPSAYGLHETRDEAVTDLATEGSQPVVLTQRRRTRSHLEPRIDLLIILTPSRPSGSEATKLSERMPQRCLTLRVSRVSVGAPGRCHLRCSRQALP